MTVYNDVPESLPNQIVGRVKDEYFYQGDDTQRFPIGCMYRLGKKSFAYARAGATLVPNIGCKAYGRQTVAYATVAASSIVGATELTIDIAASDGAAGDGILAKDELYDGEVVIFPHSDNAMCRRILGNTAVATGGGECTLTLEHGLGIATVVDVTHAECIGSMFKDVRSTNGTVDSIVGVPVNPATVGQFTFIQTWGPVWISPQGAVSVGNNNREVVFRHDGSIDEHDYSDAVVAKAQHAGFVIYNAIGGGQGAPFIFLQIAR